MSNDYYYNKILKELVEAKLGNDTTFANELDTMGKIYFKNHFKGVFPSDIMPELKNGDCCLFNLDKHNEQGSHWIAVYCDKKNIIVYDSFGRPTKKIIPTLSNLKKHIIDAEYDPEQKIIENNCGQRSLAWLLFLKAFGIKRALLI